MNFNEEIEEELKAVGILGGKVVPISEEDKGTPEDWKKLERQIKNSRPNQDGIRSTEYWCNILL